jgi:hypothetical protein
VSARSPTIRQSPTIRHIARIAIKPFEVVHVSYSAGDPNTD